jgi:hypothetical protein
MIVSRRRHNDDSGTIWLERKSPSLRMVLKTALIERSALIVRSAFIA